MNSNSSQTDSADEALELRSAPPAEYHWWLVGSVDDSGSLLHVPVGPFPFRIGRRPGASLCLQAPTISHLHAEIRQRDGELFIRDMGSTNGTFINGVPVNGEIPLHDSDLVQFSKVTFRVSRRGADVEDNIDTVLSYAGDQAVALVQFERLLNERAAIPYFQPIQELATRQTVGYEILGRSRLFGLQTPHDMFMIASQLNLAAELSRVFRQEGIEEGSLLPGLPNLFVNTHPVELVERGILDSLRAIREVHPHQPITLEIHEAAATDLAMLRELSAALKELRIELAFDDFGAGQARLVELVEVSPQYLKFDMQLIRGINIAPPTRRQMIATLVRMTRELGITPIAEGIETLEEYETCQEINFELGQGFFIGRPAGVSHYLGRACERQGVSREASVVSPNNAPDSDALPRS
ncbi:MAG: EAL domain-containing protein [Pirellulales bacterium]